MTRVVPASVFGSGPRDAAQPRWLLVVAGAALLLGLAASIRFFLQRDGFSEDEFAQLTFVNETLPAFFMQFVRLDQHPFFHFLQLKLWGLVSAEDRWMLANSLVWHVASCMTVFLVGRAWQGAAAGLLAAALYALLPQVVGASITLRMYAMIPGLAVLAWWLNLLLLSGRERRPWVWATLVLVEFALAYSHAIAFYFCFFISVAAAMQVRMERPAAPAWRRWLLVQGGVALLIAPLVVLALARTAMSPPPEAGGNADPGSPVDHLGGMVAGWGMTWGWARWMGAAFYAAAVALGLWRRASRPLAAIILVAPYLTAIVVGALLAPLFKTPLYSAMLVPFACLAMGSALVATRPLAALPVLAALVAFVGPASALLNSSVSPYRTIAEELQRRVKPGDLVVVPKPIVYWAVVRYAVGPAWGSALDVMPPPSDGWLRVTQRLGQAWSERLHLVPRTTTVLHRDVRYLVGEEALEASRHAQQVWVVLRPRYPATVHLDDSLVRQGLIVEAGTPETTQIVLYQRAAAAPALAR